MYEPTIGLEVHAELKTQTKMFCACKNDSDEERPNVNVCPICLGHPGTLPVPNEEAVRHILRVGTAVGGTIARDFSEFDRKSYFYPDIPKGFQISQYEYPFVAGGTLAGVALTRIHLEEDTARSAHEPHGSAVDFNRAGIPLMELVTEPVIHDAETAGRFARELQLLLRTLSAGDANLEKGEMRVEANISVSNISGTYGTKVEIKNLNSFRSVERAIAYEIRRQSAELENGRTVRQETRGWDEEKQETFHQRFKEGSADYRYFPEPDIPKLILSELPAYAEEAIRVTLPELPASRRARYAESYGLSEQAVAYLADSIERSSFFDSVARELSGERALVTLAANYLISDTAGFFAKQGEERYEDISAAAFADLIRMAHGGELSSRGAKDVLGILLEKGGVPKDIAREQGLLQVNDAAALGAVADIVLKEEMAAVAEYHAGKESAIQYLIGKGMKASGGAGNPEILKQIFTEKLRQ